MRAGIDCEHLERYVLGDDALRAEVLTIFEGQIRALREGLNPVADDEEWHDRMHAMKGAARGVGAWQVGRLCERAEALVGDKPDKAELRKATILALTRALDDAADHAARLKDGADIEAEPVSA
ncbi:MAG: Hpt domain-containing protein [Pseudomonadota bacterium]